MFGSWSPGKKKPIKDEPGYRSVAGSTCLVTGSSGLCGARLVEMLLERGASKVIAFDVASPTGVLEERFQQVQDKTGGTIIVCSGLDGDITSDEAVEAAFSKADKIDVVYHIAALVGPFHDKEKYMAVNYYGTVRIIEMCQKFKVQKLVYSSSPSTRFTGKDITGQTEDELPVPNKWLAMYAEAKAYGEMTVTKANNSPDLLTISVAPHQIYGPHDGLFLTKILETAGNGRLRIFGEGLNKISVCYVDNYCHGLMCGADALYADSPALGKFYIVTDGEPVYLWSFINDAVVGMGFTDLYTKFHLPVWFLYLVAYAANVLGWLLNKKFKLNPFNVRMLTMNRFFSIANAQRDLKYAPVKPQKEAWPYTIQWFQEHWLPKFLEESAQKKKAD